MARILVVDDEPDLCEILCFNLESEGFEADRAYSAESALEMMDGGEKFDLILLDVMMDSMSGFEMAHRLRGQGDQSPIIFLTARTTESDQLDGFAAGGDDYVTKPFSFPTVLARIKAVLKRASASNDDSICCGGIVIDKKMKSVSIDGEAVALTKKEFGILSLLMSGMGQHFTRQDIIDKVWEDDTYIGDRSVDVHIARLRKKLRAYGECIVNHIGFGYTLITNN